MGKVWKKKQTNLSYTNYRGYYYSSRFFPGSQTINTYFNELVYTIPFDTNCEFGCEYLFQDSHYPKVKAAQQQSSRLRRQFPYLRK